MQSFVSNCVLSPRIGFFSIVGAVLASFTIGCAPTPNPPAGKASSNSTETISPGKPASQTATESVPSAPTDKTSEMPKTAQASSAEPHPLDQVAPLIPREVLFGNPDKAMARMSHDAKRLAYLAPVDGVLNVWVGPIDDPSAAKPVTHEKSRPIGGYFWAYTDKHILYSQDDKGDENFHVYAVNLDTGETKDITPLDQQKAADPNGEKPKVRAEIEGVSWRSPEEIVIGLNDRDPEYHDLYLVNINTGAKIAHAESRFLRFCGRRRLQGSLCHKNDRRRRQPTV